MLWNNNGKMLNNATMIVLIAKGMQGKYFAVTDLLYVMLISEKGYLPLMQTTTYSVSN